MSDYEIRQYQPDDRTGFLSLYRTVMGGESGDDWFDWKYDENPYTDHVSMVVGVSEGEIVGARPFFALPLCVDGDREIALQPGDTVVHPDHRRQGLFTRMTERAIERYAEDHPFFFNFPNDQSRPGYLKLGWEVVSRRSSYYRIENPGKIAESRSGGSPIRIGSKIATPVARGYYGFRDRTVSPTADLTIRRESDTPAEELAALYRSAVPDAVHALRDGQFYRWRLGNPNWEYTTYIADRETGPVAAIVTGTSVDRDLTTTKLADVVPLVSAPEPALESLISQVLTDHSETDLFAAPSQGFPEAVLRKFGFLSDATPPLSFFTSRTTHVVRTLTDSREQIGRTVTDPEHWLMTFLEEDTS